MAGLASLIIGLGLLYHGAQESALQLYLRGVGAPVIGAVDAVFRGRSGERTRIRVAYTDFQGSQRRATVTARSSAWRRGETAKLLVSLRFPQLAMLEDSAASGRLLRENAVLGAIGAALAPLGLWLYGGFHRRRRLALGRVPFREAEGEVLCSEERPYRLGDYTPLAVRYAFNAVDGRQYEGRSPDLPRGHPPPPPGPVRIRYARRDPSRSLPLLPGD